MTRIVLLLSFLFASGLTLCTVGCAPDGKAPEVLRLATTTSTRDSGLLDVLVPLFEEQRGARVDVIAVGTGKALALGRAGDVDAVLVHAERAELQFMADGHGTRREPVMFNTFAIVGPADDPAAVAGLDPLEALKRIAAVGATFISRGDDSGTHKRERQLWEEAGGRPQWEGYLESGAGMAATLVMADEKRGYTLADSGTFLAMQDKCELAALVGEGEALHNPYAILVVDGSKNEHIAAPLAEAFCEFLITRETQERIAEFEAHGERLFHPLRIERE